MDWPDHITEADAPALADLAAAGVGEGDFDDDHTVPPELTELWIDLHGQGKTPDDLAAWAAEL